MKISIALILILINHLKPLTHQRYILRGLPADLRQHAREILAASCLAIRKDYNLAWFSKFFEKDRKILEYLLIGGGFAFAAAIQPGPLQAFLLSSVAQKGWRRTLPASLCPLLSDGPIVLLTLLVLSRIPETLSRVLQAAGGIFLLYLAWVSYRQWKSRTITETDVNESAPRTLMQAAMVNLLNPNPYLAWSLVMGPAVLAAWGQSPANAAALMIAFYVTMVAVLACTVLLFGMTGFLGPGGRRALILMSAVTLAALGVYQLVTSLLRAAAA